MVFTEGRSEGRSTTTDTYELGLGAGVGSPELTEDFDSQTGLRPTSSAVIKPKTAEQLAVGLRREAHDVGHAAIARMIREQGDDRWL